MSTTNTTGSKAKPNANPARLMIGPARFSYANIFKARAVEAGGDESFSVTLLIPKFLEDGKTVNPLIAKIEATIAVAAEEGKKSKFGGKEAKNIPNFKWPLHDGDEEKPGEPAYEGMMYVNARNARKPGVLFLKDGAKIPATDESEVYSGSWGYATVTFFPFDKKGKGIGASLGNILKTKDDDRLAGGPSAEQDFADFEEDGNDML